MAKKVKITPAAPGTFLPDCTDFTDIPVKKRDKYMKGYVKCPKCKGHGNFNLRLNAYGEWKHFQGVCSQCNGWGWVHPDNTKCIHDWQEIGQDECRERGIYHAGRCFQVYACTKKGCNATMSQDSSD